MPTRISKEKLGHPLGWEEGLQAAAREFLS